MMAIVLDSAVRGASLKASECQNIYIYMLNIKFGYHLTWKKRKVTGPKIGAPFSNLDSLEAWVYLGMLLFLDVVQAVVEGDSAQKLLLQSMKDEARAGVPTAIQPHRE